jgi:hypothetical protein
MINKKSRNYTVIDRDYLILYDDKFQMRTRIHPIMVTWSWRYIRRYLCIGYSLLFLLILFVNFQMCKWKSNIRDDRIDRPAYCDQSIIRKHFMHDQRYLSLISLFYFITQFII